MEGRIELMGRRRRRRKQLLAYLKETGGYCKLKLATSDCSVWRTRFRRGYGQVVGQTNQWFSLGLLQASEIISEIELDRSGCVLLSWTRTGG